MGQRQLNKTIQNIDSDMKMFVAATNKHRQSTIFNNSIQPKQIASQLFGKIENESLLNIIRRSLAGDKGDKSTLFDIFFEMCKDELETERNNRNQSWKRFGFGSIFANESRSKYSEYHKMSKH